jgi:hypothetical protein
MRTIWKYEIFPETVLGIPKDGKFLAVQRQGDRVCAWFEVESENEKQMRKFHIVATGHKVAGTKYLGTFQFPPLVFHVYEEVIDE